MKRVRLKLRLVTHTRLLENCHRIVALCSVLIDMVNPFLSMKL